MIDLMVKKVLMICYYYPPLTDVGCKRSVAYSKYWKEAGCEPYVLSVKNPDKTYCAMGNEVPPDGVSVIYVTSLFNVYRFFGKLNGLLSRILRVIGIKHEKNYFYDLFCIPDIFIGWIPLAILKGRKLIRDENIDVVYVSCSPFSSGIIGWWIKKLTGKPLVIDYRDPYGLDISKYQKGHMPSWFRRPVDRWVSGMILGACDLFTVTSEETRQLYIEQFPLIKDRIHTIFNGFDHHFLEGLKVQKKFNKFTIIYTGNFYYDVEFDYFFAGLGLLKKNGKICADNFQFLFYGGHFERIQDAMLCYEITDLVQVKPRIPYREVLKEIKRSHLQLLRITQPMISTKLFEGIALDIPFLATVPTGEVEGIINKYSPDSFVVIEQCPDAVEKCIDNAMTQSEKNGFQGNLVGDFLENYSRRSQSHKYFELMQGTVRES